MDNPKYFIEQWDIVSENITNYVFNDIIYLQKQLDATKRHEPILKTVAVWKIKVKDEVSKGHLQQ